MGANLSAHQGKVANGAAPRQRMAAYSFRGIVHVHIMSIICMIHDGLCMFVLYTIIYKCLVCTEVESKHVAMVAVQCCAAGWSSFAAIFHSFKDLDVS